MNLSGFVDYRVAVGNEYVLDDFHIRLEKKRVGDIDSGCSLQQRRRAIEALEARAPQTVWRLATVVNSIQNRVKSITVCVTLNANTGKIVLVTLCIQIEWLFYNAFWCETVTRKRR